MSYPDTDAIRAREQAATPGPWEIVLIDDGRFYGEPPTFDIASTANGRHESVASGGVLEDGGPVLGAALGIDAEFIAHARSDVPALLDALAAAERAAQSWEKMAREANHAAVEAMNEADAFRRGIGGIEPMDGQTPEQAARADAERTLSDTYPDGRPKMHRHFGEHEVHQDSGCERQSSRRRVYVFDAEDLDRHESFIASRYGVTGN